MAAHDMVQVECQKLARMLLCTRACDLDSIVRDVLTFFFEYRHDIRRRTARDRNEEHLDRIRSGVPISFYIK